LHWTVFLVLQFLFYKFFLHVLLSWTDFKANTSQETLSISTGFLFSNSSIRSMNNDPQH
jgi:hypothetical protein